MKLCITKRYKEKCVFDGFALEILSGEVTCILGASGVGKTTLLKAVAGLSAFQGELDAQPSAFVFQEDRLLPHLTAEENLLYVGATVEQATTALKICRMQGKEHRLASTLSGGEKQRVALARAFCKDAPVWLLDEPFSALDTPLKTALWQDFISLWSKKKPTVLLVTHDLEEAWCLGHRILVLKDGKIAYDCRPSRVKLPVAYGEPSEEKQSFFNAVLSTKN